MWSCPICGKQNENGLLCADCGFDLSSHYEKYRTLVRAERYADLKQAPALGAGHRMQAPHRPEQEPDWSSLSWNLETIEELIYYAKRGFPGAQYVLGGFYKSESVGREMRERGDFWIEQAAKQGYPGSMAGRMTGFSVVAGSRALAGLQRGGRALAVGDDMDGQCRLTGWRDITAVSGGAG